MDLKEALTVAIDYEHRVRDHYARGTEALLDPKAKKVFETLAREEQGHITYLESRLAEWQKRGYVDSPELPTILPSVAWVQTARDRLADLPAGTTTGNEMDLLKTALELERGGPHQSFAAALERAGVMLRTVAQDGRLFDGL